MNPGALKSPLSRKISALGSPRLSSPNSLGPVSPRGGGGSPPGSPHIGPSVGELGPLQEGGASPEGWGEPQSEEQLKVVLMDVKKAYNLSIVLARFRMSHEQIRKACLSLDESVLTEEKVEVLWKQAPSKEEIEAGQQYRKQVKKREEQGLPPYIMGEADKFLLAVCDVGGDRFALFFSLVFSSTRAIMFF